MTDAKLRDRLGLLLIVAFVVALGGLFWRVTPDANKDLITYMLGQLSGFVSAVILFHYGANSSSQRASENTGKLADAFKATAEAGTPAAGINDPAAIREGDTITVNKEPEA